MSEQYGTLFITMTVDVPDLNSDMYKLRIITLAKAYMPRSKAEGYVKKFMQCNPCMSDADWRAEFKPECERIAEFTGI